MIVYPVKNPAKGLSFGAKSLKDIAKCLLKQQLINRHTGNNIDITFSTIVIDYIIHAIDRYHTMLVLPIIYYQLLIYAFI